MERDSLREGKMWNCVKDWKQMFIEKQKKDTKQKEGKQVYYYNCIITPTTTHTIFYAPVWIGITILLIRYIIKFRGILSLRIDFLLIQVQIWEI